MKFTLAGAFHPPSSVLDQRRILVRFDMDDGVTVHAESLAERALARLRVHARFPVVDYRFSFLSDRGEQLALLVTHGLARPRCRALTELSGTLTVSGGPLIGLACLRVDWRRSLLGH